MLPRRRCHRGVTSPGLQSVVGRAAVPGRSRPRPRRIVSALGLSTPAAPGFPFGDRPGAPTKARVRGHALRVGRRCVQPSWSMTSPCREAIASRRRQRARARRRASIIRRSFRSRHHPASTSRLRGGHRPRAGVRHVGSRGARRAGRHRGLVSGSVRGRVGLRAGLAGGGTTRRTGDGSGAAAGRPDLLHVPPPGRGRRAGEYVPPHLRGGARTEPDRRPCVPRSGLVPRAGRRRRTATARAKGRRAERGCPSPLAPPYREKDSCAPSPPLGRSPTSGLTRLCPSGPS